MLRAQPTHAIAWNGVGAVLAAAGNVAEARTAFAKAVDAAPDFAEARYNLGFAASALGDHDAALRETERALGINPYYVPQSFELNPVGQQGLGFVAGGFLIVNYEDSYAIDRCFGDMALETTLGLSIFVLALGVWAVG